MSGVAAQEITCTRRMSGCNSLRYREDGFLKIASSFFNSVESKMFSILKDVEFKKKKKQRHYQSVYS